MKKVIISRQSPVMYVDTIPGNYFRLLLASILEDIAWQYRVNPDIQYPTEIQVSLLQDVFDTRMLKVEVFSDGQTDTTSRDTNTALES